MNKYLKAFLYTLGVLALVVLLASFIAPFFLETYLEEEIVKEFSSQTNDGYELSLGGVNLNILGQSFAVDSISITPASEEKELRRLKAKKIQINGLSWVSLLNKPFPSFSSITVIEPDVEFLARPISATRDATENDSSMVNLEELSEFDVHILNGSGRIIMDNGAEVFSMGNFSLTADQVNLNTVLRGSYAPYLEDLTITGSDLKWTIEKKLYQFSIDSLDFSKSGHKADIMNLQFTPLVEKYRFAELRGRELDRFDLSIPDLRFRGLNLDQIAGKKADIDSLYITGAVLDVFHDKHMPPAQGLKLKPMLNDVATDLDYSFGLNTAIIRDTRIKYGEHRPASDDPGYISFDQVNATLKNFRTASHPGFKEDTLSLHVETKFMNVGDFTLDVSYLVFDENDTHTIKASLGEMDPKEVNPMLENVAFVRIDNGMIRGMDMQMTLTDDSSTGSMNLRYEDLKITVLENNRDKGQNLRTRLSSFVANNFIMKSSNLPPELREGEISFEREKDKGIFGYWWKSTLSGLKSSIK